MPDSIDWINEFIYPWMESITVLWYLMLNCFCIYGIVCDKLVMIYYLLISNTLTSYFVDFVFIFVRSLSQPMVRPSLLPPSTVLSLPLWTNPAPPAWFSYLIIHSFRYTCNLFVVFVNFNGQNSVKNFSVLVVIILPFKIRRVQWVVYELCRYYDRKAKINNFVLQTGEMLSLLV